MPMLRSSRQGFTLLELILVLVVVAIMLAVVGPRMSGLHARSRIDHAAATTLAMMNQCRVRAINEGTPHRLVIDPATRQIWIEARTPTGYARPRSGYDAPYVWDDALSLTADQLVPNTDGYLTIGFNADGTAESAELRFDQPGQTPRHLWTSSPAEPYRILIADRLDLKPREGFDVPNY